jgi:hypothetical protein
MTRDQMAAKIESLKTPAGGWTKASLASLGVSWPPPSGWKSKLLDSAGCLHKWYMRDAGITCIHCLTLWDKSMDQNS